MKKTLLILVLSLLVVSISFSVFVQGGQALTAVGPAIHQEEDYWKEKYDELKKEFDRLVNIIVPQVEALSSSLDEMRSNIDKMRSELETSRTAYKTLEVKYESTLRELNTRTTMMYAFMVTTAVFVVTTLYLALKRRKTAT